MNNFQPSQAIECLICYAHAHLHLNEEDIIYVRNKLLDIFQVEPCMDYVPEQDKIERMKSPTAIVAPLVDYAVKNKITNEENALRFETMLIDAVCPSPGMIMGLFDRAYARNKDIKPACDMLYDFCFKSNYIRYEELSRNIKWIAPAQKGTLEITINTAKPEKDIKAIAAARKSAPKQKYPLCVLCKENVGFTGKPFRHTLRTIPLDLKNANGDYERWHLQYSPYNYYPEHCIVLSDKHVPMCMDASTLTRLFDFIEIFPHYFLGSNASIPIVGGSILSHEHYQGGSHQMPMYSAKTKARYTSPQHPAARISIIDWYNSVIRIESTQRTQVESLTEQIRQAWCNYNNPKLNILSKSDEQHSDITLIARFNSDKEYCAEIILRNNRTDEKSPDGIFHVSQDLHNIKKENIGLIEAMGVFILPARLASEAAAIRDYLTGEKELVLQELADENNPLHKHIGLIAQLANDFGTSLSDAEAGKQIEQAINKACERILRCTAVFKEDTAGEKGFKSFMEGLGLTHSKDFN